MKLSRFQAETLCIGVGILSGLGMLALIKSIPVDRSEPARGVESVRASEGGPVLEHYSVWRDPRGRCLLMKPDGGVEEIGGYEPVSFDVPSP
jgi:hypothetical protein